MTEKNDNRSGGKRPQSTRRRTIVSSVLFTVAVMAVALVFFLPWLVDYYTDGFSIHQPRHEALVREILWENPVRFDNTINGESANYEPTLSSDGLTMIFTRGKARHNADLYVARWDGSAWADPQPLDGVNSPDDELGPELSRDGAYLYFYSNREGGFGGYDIWVCRRAEDGWSTPENLGEYVNSPFNEYGPGLAPDGQRLFFSSNRLKRTLTEEEKDAWQATLRENFFVGDYDIFSAAIASWPATADPSPEEAVLPRFPAFGQAGRVAALNSSRDEGQVAVTPRGDFVYFSSNRAGGLGGFDLYRSRILAGEIEDPENMGAPVNTVSDDMDPSLFLEGHGLLLSSNRIARAGDRPFLLFKTVSREVFTAKDWSGLAALLRWLDKMKWILLLLLLSLLALLWLLRYLASPQFRLHASLLQRCLLASLLLHLLLALLFSTWIVSSGLYDLAGDGLAEVFIDSDALAGERLGLEIREQVSEIEMPTDTREAESPADTLAMLDRAQPVDPAEIDFDPVPLENRSAASVPSVPLPDHPDPEMDRPSHLNAMETMRFDHSALAFEVPDPSAEADEPELPRVDVGETSTRLSHEQDLPATSAARPEQIDLESPVVTGRESVVAVSDQISRRDHQVADSIDPTPVTDLPVDRSTSVTVEIAMESLQNREREESRDFESPAAPGASTRTARTEQLDRNVPRARANLPERQLIEPVRSDRSAVAARPTSIERSNEQAAESLPEVARHELAPQSAASTDIEMEIPRKPSASEQVARSDERESESAVKPRSPSVSERRVDPSIIDMSAATRPLPLLADRGGTLRDPLPLPQSEESRPKPSTIELASRPRDPEMVAEISRFEHGTPRTYHGLEMTSHRVVFCLDISGSMEWNNRIGEARQELLRLLDTLDESVEFNIITFSGRMTIWNRGGLQAGTPENITSAKRFVRRTRTASDGTNTVGALSLALDDEKVKSIYFLSDGHPTVGFTTRNDEILSHINEQQAGRGVIINTIAYIKGDPPRGWRDQVPPKETLIELMQRLAEQNDGNYVVFD